MKALYPTHKGKSYKQPHTHPNEIYAKKKKAVINIKIKPFLESVL